MSSAGPAGSEQAPIDANAAPRGWASRLLESGRHVLEAIDPALSPRFLFGSVGGLLLGVLALVIYLRSGDELKPVKVRLLGPKASLQAPREPRLTLMIAPNWSAHERIEPYELLARYLGQRLSEPVVVAQRRTQGEVSEQLEHGKVQAGVLSVGAYLHARARGARLAALALPVASARSTHHGVIIVAADSELHTLADLRGRSFAFTDPESLTGYYAPLAALSASPRALPRPFSNTLFTYADEESIKAVRNGRIAAAAVSSDVLDRELEDTPSARGALRVIHRSPEFGLAPIVVTDTLSPELRTALASALQTMHEHEDGRLALGRLHLERFVEPTEALYDSAASLIAPIDGASGEAP